jgi:multicomponent K+:H+ antiporter subunit D
MSALDHLVVVPILLPLLAGAAMLVIDEGRRALKGAISIASMLALVAAAVGLARLSAADTAPVYAVGAWPAPFGIVLVADRLAAAMVLLASVLGLAAFTFSLARWQRAGARFHSQVMFLLAGVNGAFLTGDLFNLFVFFELLLAASYGLALHGSGLPRVTSSLHYIVINLAASLLFLVGVSLVYGVTGTLNMAQLAQRIAAIAAGDRVLAEIGVALLSVAFLVKAGMWPLCFWLPTTYAAASAPAAALFTILSKVGVYAVARLWLLLFGAGVGGELLLWGGLATLAFGAIALVASQDLARMAASSLLVSSGTLLASLSRAHEAATSAALFYLVSSTLGIAALFMLIELVQRMRPPGADVIAVTAEAFGTRGGEEEVEEESAHGIPAAMAVLAACFIACAVLVAGLPPLSGFLAKFGIFAAVLGEAPQSPASWALVGMLTLSSFAAVIALGRAGVRIFWVARAQSAPSVRAVEIAPIVALLFLCLALTVAAGPAMRFLDSAARTLHEPRSYIDSVLPPR